MPGLTRSLAFAAVDAEHPKTDGMRVIAITAVRMKTELLLYSMMDGILGLSARNVTDVQNAGDTMKK